MLNIDRCTFTIIEPVKKLSFITNEPQLIKNTDEQHRYPYTVEL